jgi:arylsulfatase A-like enzyme
LTAFLGQDALGLPFMLEEAGRRLALRQGQWKYIAPAKGDNKPGRGAGPGAALYDIASDPGESTNLIHHQPVLAAQLDARLQQLVQAKRIRSN